MLQMMHTANETILSILVSNWDAFPSDLEPNLHFVRSVPPIKKIRHILYLVYSLQPSDFARQILYSHEDEDKDQILNTCRNSYLLISFRI